MKDFDRIFWHIANLNPVTTGIALKATETTMEIFSRRDFLKLAGLGSATLAILSCDSHTNEPVIVTPKYELNIDNAAPEQNIFTSKELFGSVVKIDKLDQSIIDPHLQSMRNAAIKLGWSDSNMRVEYLGIRYIDNIDQNVDVVFTFATPIIDGILDSNKTTSFMYTPFDEDLAAFIPLNQAKSNARGRLFPIEPFVNTTGDETNLGLFKIVDTSRIQLTVPVVNLKRDADGSKILKVFEPYSQRPFIVTKPSEAPDGIKKVLAELVPVQPQLPEGVKEKFDIAGIDIKNMSNATYDDKGLHIRLGDGSQVDILTNDLYKFVCVGFEYQSIKFGQDYFLPSINPISGEISIFTFDNLKNEWILEEVLQPVNPNDQNSCTFRHIASGGLDDMVAKMNINFPAEAHCDGWIFPNGDVGYIMPTGKSVEHSKPIKFKMKADFIGLPNRDIELLCVPIINSDRSISCINFCISNVGTAPKASDIEATLKRTSGLGLGIKSPAELSKVINDMGDDRTYAVGSRIQYLFDPNEIKDILKSGSVKELNNKINLAVIR